MLVPVGTLPSVPEDPASASSRQWTVRRAEIWDQLGELFLSDGFRNLTIGDLAARLSCSRRTLYSVAENRDDLVRGVIQHLFETRVAASAAAVDEATDAADAMVAHLTHGLLALNARTVFLEELVERPSTGQIFSAYHRESRRVLDELVAKGIANGELRATDADLVADVLDAMAMRLAERRAADPGALTLDDAGAVIRDVVRRWLCVP
jgi:AcrR family transcriptional regulator